MLPVPPAHSFSGDAGTGSGAQLDGQLAPDGTVVRAVNENGDPVGESAIVDGGWSIAVRPEDAQTVTFTVGDSLPSAPFDVTSGAVTEVPLDLVPPTQEFMLGPGFNLAGWLGGTPVEEATASIAGQFDSIFRWNAATQTFAPSRRDQRSSTTLTSSSSETLSGSSSTIRGARCGSSLASRTPVMSICSPDSTWSSGRGRTAHQWRMGSPESPRT